ncbi:hypothetical protein PINS_up020075 [Pythium insidiosum]|nr:hypothetical protein PINS_up020075 [Pythium insidiosum]
MDEAIEALRRWRHAQAVEAERIKREMNERIENESPVVASSYADTEILESLTAEFERSQKESEQARSKLQQVIQDSEASLRAKVGEFHSHCELPPDESWRTEVVHQDISQLKSELFALGVKLLSSEIEQTRMADVLAEDAELEEKLRDVEVRSRFMIRLIGNTFFF